MPNNITIVGIQWGDEGKGKITDLLARSADAVVRYQGGANAGHTVVVGDRKVILHQIPSGILNPDSLCVIGPAVVVDPDTLLTEADSLHQHDIAVTPDRLAISRSAQVVMPFHKRLDALREAARGSAKIGTTGRGIGPAYEDMFARTGIRMMDLCNPDRLVTALRRVLPERNLLIRHLGGEPFEAEQLTESMSEQARRLAPFLCDVGETISDLLAAGRKVLFESAQGTLLDVLHGTYPYVTSSMTTAPAAFPLLGVGVPAERQVLGVVKAYTTRVGAGPFPTEDPGPIGQRLRDVGGEYGATTGRPRRCGFLDLPALRYAVRVNGLTGLAVTKLDVLSGIDEMPVCTGYRLGGEVLTRIHPELFDDPALTPIYESWPGWKEDVSGVRDLADLPAAARTYLDRLQEALAVPILLVSTGSDRDATIFARDPWA
jgi:adenylosuccinate synthase